MIYLHWFTELDFSENHCQNSVVAAFGFKVFNNKKNAYELFPYNIYKETRQRLFVSVRKALFFLFFLADPLRGSAFCFFVFICYVGLNKGDEHDYHI